MSMITKKHRGMTVDVMGCLQQGAVGAAGAIPGTIAAHPVDLVKIRMQVTAGASFRTAFKQQIAAGPFRGLAAGVQQKVLTRGPMFFFSEVGTQTCQMSTGWSRDKAVSVGSFASGYLTGFSASLAEWAKVQRAVHGTSACNISIKAMQLARTSIQCGHSASIFRRMRGAGLRNAIFDSTFFGVEHRLRTGCELPQAFTFAAAAAAALCLDYPIDVAAKRSFAKGPIELVPHGSIMAVVRLFQQTERLSLVFRGLGCKGVEFATSYCVTGVAAPSITRAFVAVTSMLVAYFAVDDY